jgi:S1-C subfamily serine protease
LRLSNTCGIINTLADKKGIMSNIRTTIKRSLRIKLKVAAVLSGMALFTGVVVLLGALAPGLHNSYIRSTVGAKVVRLTNLAENSGGTGFALKAASGRTYIITNAHVCNIPGSYLYSRDVNGKRIRFTRVKVSIVTDLCALSNPTNIEGLTVSGGVELGETVGILGHPKLQPLTLTLGEIVGYEQVAVLVRPGPCKLERGMYKTEQTISGPLCTQLVRDAGLTNIPVRGGSSGSPVVNFFGNVVGVLFAGDELGWGVVISRKELVKFLRNL